MRAHGSSSIDLPVPSDRFTQRLQASLGASLRLERELTGGGSARVFLAHDVTLDRRLVVKAALASWATDANVKRFEREIRIIAKLQHPHIVPLLAAGGEDGLLWYTTPWVQGRSLRHRLLDRGALPAPEALRLLRDLARALAFAHRSGVVHRDVKPDNVLISDGIGLLIDFGIARALEVAGAESGLEAADGSRLTRPGNFPGTPAYTSPEQMDGTALPQTDLYALACTAYELLSGDPPFMARTAEALFTAHALQTPPSLASRCPTLPASLARILEQCLAKKPSERPAAADAVVAALDAALLRLVPRDEEPSSIRNDAEARSIASEPNNLPNLSSVVDSNPTSFPPVVLVLPFDPGTGSAPDSDAAVLADGFTEELISALGVSGGVRVIGRAITATLRNRRDDPRQLAAQLGATTLVSGSVRVANSMVRIAVEAADAVLGQQQWAHRYVRPLDDLFAVQDEVADEISRAVAVRLGALVSPEVVGRDSARPMPVEAVRWWLEARRVRRHQPEDSNAALAALDAALNAAISAGTPFARAHAAKATLLLDIALAPGGSASAAARIGGSSLASRSALEAAEDSARAALASQPRDLDAQSVLGAVALVHRWAWSEARGIFVAVLAQDSRHPIAVPFGVLLEVASGRPEAAQRILDNAPAGGADLPSVSAPGLAAVLAHAVALANGETAPIFDEVQHAAEAGRWADTEAALNAAADARDWRVITLGVNPAYAALRSRPVIGDLVQTIWGWSGEHTTPDVVDATRG